ncbi:MAG: bifunctional 4-hydroxy-2-oxoglutarate aldolase/2-dehydro-3-deoxy-phosphogluconate aldolase [Sphaerochaetaceae bacterium]|nr:bifunctional 4-hydroxy-2-oxoglutarate aldolase/2-dehydro-3-deoxy-phosphogluconate aldolase [Sphaerochaetaceae bacterium]
MMDQSIIDILEKKGIVAVLVIDDLDTAVDSAKALVKGGITAIELALRTPVSYEAIELIHKNVPEMMIGVGTVIKPGQAQKVKELGASFAVAPGLNPKIMKEAKECGLPFAPGISTASELEKAVELGCKLVKLFPAEALGGIKYFKAMTGPYKYLGIKYFPLGGVSEENLPLWASEKDICPIGGSWIAKGNLIKEKNYTEITKRAREAVKIYKEIKKDLK